MSVTDIVLGLGATVLKTACRIWLQDSPFAADASQSVIDMVESRVEDARQRRRILRRFGEIEETVADRIVSALGPEWRRLGDGEKTAAALAVRDALDRVPLTDRDLLAQDLDPLYLERHVRARSPLAARDLSEAGSALYDRILRECCTDVVELTTGLPGFGPAAFAEVLRRETTIVEMVRQLLDRVPAREAPGKSTDEAEFAAAYRRQVSGKLDRIELFGITLSGPSRQYPLSTAYVALDIDITTGKELDRALQLDLVSRPLKGRMRVDEAMARTSRLFIRGDPGSGKTTLMHWLAVRSARYDFPDELARWNATVPFLIPLRHYTERSLPEPAEFVRYTGRHVADLMPSGWVEELLREGAALVLVDGVDELPAVRRQAVRLWLRELVTDFPDARYVVTSRLAATDASWLDSQDFTTGELQPLTDHDIQIFIRQWHEAARDGVVDADQRTQLRQYEQRLVPAVLSNRHLRDLATSPLLCALICALHRDRRARLPNDRLEIYEAALEMLLERRDLEQGIIADDPGLSRREKTVIVQELAYWLLRNGWSDVPIQTAQEQIARTLSSLHRVHADHATVFTYLAERSGLLRQPAPGTVSFIHRTFQEYLAAKAIIDMGDLGLAVNQAEDDQWREVTIMAAGSASANVREQLIKDLLARADQVTSKKTGNKLRIVALGCLEGSAQISAALRSQIEAQAEHLLPPRTMAHAEALAAVGEFALTRLARHRPKGAREAAATIRAASLIGGPGALEVVTQAARTRGDEVRDELVKAWSRFPPEEFARTVMNAACIESLEISDAALFPALRLVTGLRELSYDMPGGHNDLSFIRHLPELTTLSIIQDPVLQDLTPLTSHPNLREIRIYDARGPVEFGPLRSCPMLTSIWLTAVQDVNNLRGFLPPQQLDQFALWIQQDLTSLEPILSIEQMSKLSTLCLARSPFRSLSGIEILADTLTRLSIGLAPGASLAPLRALSKLHSLYIDQTALVDLSPLDDIANLTIHVIESQHVLSEDLLGPGSQVQRDYS